MILRFSIQYFGTVTTSQGALIIGGHDGAAVATVACYNGTHNLWVISLSWFAHLQNISVASHEILSQFLSITIH